MESEDSENSSASGNKMETQQIFSSKSRIDRSRMRTRVGISPPVPFKYGALSIYEKNPEISVVAKVEFPIGKKLFHLVVNPGTWPGARLWTWNWYKLQETSIEHDIPLGNSNRENGTTFLDFPLFLGIFQWDEPTKRVHLPPSRKFRKFWLNGKRPWLLLHQTKTNHYIWQTKLNKCKYEEHITLKIKVATVSSI